jgi:hypothetical protein
MNEHEWLNCDDSIPMLEFLESGLAAAVESPAGEIDSAIEVASGTLPRNVIDRKLRLFACACMARPRELRGPDQRHAIRISEQYADGLVDRAALEAAFVPIRKLPDPIPLDADMALSVFGPTDMAWEAKLIEVFLTLGPDLDARAVAMKTAELITLREGTSFRRGTTERNQQAHLLRDIFGNPFRPVHLDPSSLSERTRAVAASIYEKGQFAKLPELAKALKKDPACPSRDMWDHCQWPTEHVRGCWVLDLVLGKS